MKRRTRRRGFTLLEILIVVAIIGLLAALGSVSFSVFQKRSRDSKRVSDLSEIRKAIEFGFKPGSGYPEHATAVFLGEGPNRVFCAQAGSTHFVPDSTPSNCDQDGVYIGLIPPDPIAPIQHYAYTGTETTFCIEANLEYGTGQYEAGPIRADETSLRSGTCP